MSELLTAAQMRAIEQAAIESGDVTGLDLMERAGRGVVEAVFEEWPELAKTSHRAVVLCGPGNNGGDGFVVARLLHQRGWEVEVFLYGDPSKLPPDARVNYERWIALGRVELLDLAHGSPFPCPVGDIVVDALFGTGLARPFEPSQGLVDYFETLSDPGLTAGARVVAIDIPSGLCANSGRPLGIALFSHLTVSFHRRKLGHVLGEGPWRSGTCAVADIGLPRVGCLPLEVVEWSSLVRDAFFTRQALGALAGKSNSPEGSHKYDHGHAFILSGASGKGGAARMAARGALRIGAGLVTLGCPPEALAENAAQLNAIMLEPVADAGVLAELLKDTRKNAICIGPGFGTSAREADILARVLQAKRPTVLDADALSLIALSETLFGMVHEACVLTPHAGEFARLFPDINEKLSEPATRGPAYSKLEATRDAAKRAGCVVLFKGADTVIATPEGRAVVNSAHYARVAPWLATAGSGDVLAGFITGMLARGFSPMMAAETAAWSHVECALSFGPGLIAEDLPEELPKVFRALGV